MTGNVAGNINHARQTGDMRAERLNRARKSGNRTAESLRADTGGVDLIKNLLLHLGVQRIGVVLIDRTQQRTLGEICRLIARAAQTGRR